VPLKKNYFVVLQIGKAKYLSAPLRIDVEFMQCGELLLPDDGLVRPKHVATIK
jgi:hypothetical protein